MQRKKFIFTCFDIVSPADLQRRLFESLRGLYYNQVYLNTFNNLVRNLSYKNMYMWPYAEEGTGMSLTMSFYE